MSVAPPTDFLFLSKIHPDLTEHDLAVFLYQKFKIASHVRILPKNNEKKRLNAAVAAVYKPKRIVLPKKPVKVKGNMTACIAYDDTYLIIHPELVK